MRAYVLIVTKPGTSEDVVKALKKVKGVVQADSVYGRFDVVAVVEAPDPRSLAEIVYKSIERIPDIVRIETAITLG